MSAGSILRCNVVVLVAVLLSTACPAQDSRTAQFHNLRQQIILVPTWGWSAEELAPAAVRAGFTVVNAPWGNQIEEQADEVRAWSAAGLKMLVRPTVPVKDPFDPDDVQRGLSQLQAFIRHYDKNPDVLGFTLAWGQTDEGGFPYGYEFSEHARAAFNAWMKTPGQPLPEKSAPDQPGSLRWVKWLEFRSKTLVAFRHSFVVAAKEATGKLVGTWSEFYPVAHYELNMGDAPGADFQMYDLSFGDATVTQSMAFGECHGGMENFPNFNTWRNHELPLMAKGAGEGVAPVAFQFPMRRGRQHPDATGVLFDRVEQEWCLKLGADIRALMAAMDDQPTKPEVALVYQSFAAGGLPHGDAYFWPYQGMTRQIEGMLHQMGVHMKAIPYEHLETASLEAFKLVIVPNPIYLNDAMRNRLKRAPRLLLAGEFLLTHHDPTTAAGDYGQGWQARGRWKHGALRYLRAAAGTLRVTQNSMLAAALRQLDGVAYPADQTVLFEPLPDGAEIGLSVDQQPVIFTWNRGRIVQLTNRLFLQAYRSPEPQLEQGLFHFLKGLLVDCGVTVRVKGEAHARVNHGHKPYGSYGVTGRIAWNTTAQPLALEMTGGAILTVPAHGWTVVPQK